MSSDFRTASISPVLHRPSDGPFDRHGSDGAPDGSATPSSSAQTRATSDDGAFDGGAFDGGAFDGTLADGAFDGGTLDGGVLGAAFDGGVFDGAFGASADATDDGAAAEGPCVSTKRSDHRTSRRAPLGSAGAARTDGAPDGLFDGTFDGTFDGAGSSIAVGRGFFCARGADELLTGDLWP